MRLRLFFTIFAALALTAASISAIHYHFFKLERMRLIDLNLQQNVSLLKNSDLNLSKSEYSIRGKEVIDQIIGDDKINMIVAIYSQRGNALYFNENAHIFELPQTLKEFSEWQNIETKEYFIKYLTVRDADQKRIIRVGMILNQSLLRWKDLNQRIFIYACIVLTVILFISFFLTQILFRPLQILADQVSLMSEKIEKGEFNDIKSWFSLLTKNRKREDEFGKLIYSLDKLANKITDTQEQTQKWSAMMAHELKTPMTILRNRVDELINSSTNFSPEKVSAVELEMEKLEAIITDFLEWASLENDTSSPELYAIPTSKRIHMLVDNIQPNYSKQTILIKDHTEAEQRLFCNPLHFDQVVNNLLINGIKYGEGKPITLDIYPDAVSITDQGPGLPDIVMENFGKPFNKYKQGKALGYGLGLAWVNTISKKYDWKISISNKPHTTIKIAFPINSDS